MFNFIKKRTYHFDQTDSPLFYQCQAYMQKHRFKAATCQHKASFSEKNLCLPSQPCKVLEEKHLLAALVHEYCPDIMPTTYVIHEMNVLDVVNMIQQAPTAQTHSQDTWILKPALKNNGEGIHLFSSLPSIIDYFQQTDRYSGYHVLQAYLKNPHLLQGHKYTFRLFVIVTNYTGAFLYRHGYFNVAKEPYSSTDLSHLASHLTNEHFQESSSGMANTIQIPTTQCEHFDNIYPQMFNHAQSIIQAMRQAWPTWMTLDKHSEKAFSIFGFDFILDDDLRLWLLEINHCPWFPTTTEHVLQRHLYHDFWQMIGDTFILPIAGKRSLSAVSHPDLDKL